MKHFPDTHNTIPGFVLPAGGMCVFTGLNINSVAFFSWCGNAGSSSLSDGSTVSSIDEKRTQAYDLLLIVFLQYNRISCPPGVYLTIIYDNVYSISHEKQDVVFISSGRNSKADR